MNFIPVTKKTQKKSIPGVWLPHLFPIWKPVHSVLHFLSSDSQYHFCVQHKLCTKYDLPLFGRDNVLYLTTTFSQVKNVESSTIFPLSCFEAMTRKLNCTLLGFQCQLHTVRIRILIEWDIKLNSCIQQRSCQSSPQWYITLVISTLMNLMILDTHTVYVKQIHMYNKKVSLVTQP